MKLFRFMSKKEFDVLMKGDKLINNKIHTGYTNSVVFCFMEGDTDDAEYSYQFLCGIVSDEVCVIFETDKKLTKSWGRYANPYGSFFDTMTETEYCTNEYDLEDFKPLKYTENIDYIFSDEDEWLWKEIGE